MLRKALLFVLIVGVGIQIIPVPTNQNDEVSELDFFQAIEAPVDIQKVVVSSCYDCHSNTTNYPWYGRIKPIVWFLQRHIQEGKEELNFSEFQDYSQRMQQEKIRSMTSQMRDGKMPLKEYIWMHPEAELSEGQIEILVEFLESLKFQ